MPEVQKLGAEQGSPAQTIAGLSTGGYAIAWFQTVVVPIDPDGDPFDGTEYNTGHASIYDANGTLVSTNVFVELVYDTASPDFAILGPVDIVGTGNGGYGLTYTVETFDNSLYAAQVTAFYASNQTYIDSSSYDAFPLPGEGDSAQSYLTNTNTVVVTYDHATDELFGVIYNSSGVEVGAPIDINTAPVLAHPESFDSNDPEPAVSALDGGGFAVAWTDRSVLADGDNDGTALKMRFFNAAGAATTGQLLVNTSTAGNQLDAAATKLDDGSVIVVWTDTGGNGGDAGSGIKAQRFSAAGVKIGGEFIVNTTTAGNQQNASITTLSNGTFVVVWEDRNPGGGDADGGIRGQLFSAAGAKLGSEFLVNTTTAGVQGDAEVAALSNGRFVVRWNGHTQVFDTDDFDFVAPSITSLAGSSILEYAANGAVVGTVQATDANAISYSLINNAGGRFAINAMTGQITVADGLLLDFEQAGSHVVRVRAEDAQGNVSTRDFTITVGNVTPEFLIGDARNNTFVGGAGIDRFTGGSGNDLLNGASGADVLRGGLGDDRFYIDNAGDQAIEFGGQGNDTVFTTVNYALSAGSSIETLRTGNVGGTSNLILTGNAFANAILGNAGNNRIDGGAGADDMKGFGGNDLYFVDNAGDKVTEAAGGGTDTINASVSYALGAGVHVETLQTVNAGAATAINLTGNELNNIIRGNAGMNMIRGNAGADDMYAGADAVRDTFVFAAASDSGLGAAMDQVFNFDKANFAGDPNSDKISLSLIDADDDLAGNQAFRFVTVFTAPAAGGIEGQVRIVTVGASSNIEVDIDGNNVADMTIQVVGTPGLTVNDLLL